MLSDQQRVFWVTCRAKAPSKLQKMLMTIELPNDFAVAGLRGVKIVESLPTNRWAAYCRHGIEMPVDGCTKWKSGSSEQIELPRMQIFKNVVAIRRRTTSARSRNRQQDRVINLRQAPVSKKKVRLPRAQFYQPRPGVAVCKQELLNANSELANCELTQVRTVSLHWQGQLESLPDAAQNPYLRGHKSTFQPCCHQSRIIA